MQCLAFQPLVSQEAPPKEGEMGAGAPSHQLCSTHTQSFGDHPSEMETNTGVFRSGDWTGSHS